MGLFRCGSKARMVGADLLLSRAPLSFRLPPNPETEKGGYSGFMCTPFPTALFNENAVYQYPCARVGFSKPRARGRADLRGVPLLFLNNAVGGGCISLQVPPSLSCFPASYPPGTWGWIKGVYACRSDCALICCLSNKERIIALCARGTALEARCFEPCLPQAVTVAMVIDLALFYGNNLSVTFSA